MRPVQKREKSAKRLQGGYISDGYEDISWGILTCTQRAGKTKSNQKVEEGITGYTELRYFLAVSVTVLSSLMLLINLAPPATARRIS